MNNNNKEGERVGERQRNKLCYLSLTFFLVDRSVRQVKSMSLFSLTTTVISYQQAQHICISSSKDKSSEVNMEDLLIQLDNLPDEILIHIFNKMSKFEVFYSLLDVDQGLNKLVRESSSIAIYLYYNMIQIQIDIIIVSTVSVPVLDQFYSKILLTSDHQVKSLFLVVTSMQRMLNSTNYSNLHDLSLYNVHTNIAVDPLLLVSDILLFLT